MEGRRERGRTERRSGWGLGRKERTWKDGRKVGWPKGWTVLGGRRERERGLREKVVGMLRRIWGRRRGETSRN